MDRRLRIVAVGAGLALVALPLGSDLVFNSYYLDLAARIFIIWIALLGFAILAGYTGMVSFGHAIFFGLGAYAAAWSLLHLAPVLPLSLIAGVAAATIAALVIGYLCIRTEGVYFILLTLAFAELGYQVVFNGGSITGGRNGLFSVPKGDIDIFGLIAFDWRDPVQAYYLALFAFGVAYAAARWIVNSPFGATLVAVRDNADRAAYLGYDVAAIKRRSFTISAVFAGFAGALWAHHQSYVSPELLHWSLSGQFIIMTWLGGVGTLIGPLIGGALLLSLADILSSIMKNWLVLVGALYIAVVLWAPQGLWGILVRLFQKKRS
jgi:branched-chain amino acid transport system permease protein